MRPHIYRYVGIGTILIVPMSFWPNHKCDWIACDPSLMTAGTSVPGLMPMLLSSGAATQRPLASVVVGGLITSTLVLPSVIYEWMEKRGERWARL